jgi:hypothetical protein
MSIYRKYEGVSIIPGTGANIFTAVAVARCNVIDDSTSLSRESVYKIPCSWDVLILYVLVIGVVYLAWRDFAMDPTKEQHHILCKSRKKCDRDPGTD